MEIVREGRVGGPERGLGMEKREDGGEWLGMGGGGG